MSRRNIMTCSLPHDFSLNCIKTEDIFQLQNSSMLLLSRLSQSWFSFFCSHSILGKGGHLMERIWVQCLKFLWYHNFFYPPSFPFVQIYQHLLNIYHKQCLCLAWTRGSNLGFYSLPLPSCYKYSLYQSGPWPETECMLILDSDENVMKALIIEVWMQLRKPTSEQRPQASRSS